MNRTGRLLKGVFKISFRILLLLLLVPAGFLVKQSISDPMDSPSQLSPATDSRLATDRSEYPSCVPRRVIRMTLETEALGEIPVLISLPPQAATEAVQLPVLVLASGLRGGRENVLHAPTIGNNAAVSFDYPLPKKVKLDHALTPMGLIELIRGVHRTPAQMATVFNWIADQEWAIAEKRVMVAASLGGLTFPAAWRMVQDNNPPAAGAIGYTGAGLDMLFGTIAGPAIGNDWITWLVSKTVGTALAPLEPAPHLPHIEGEFLFLYGDTDGKIPDDSVQLFADLLPEPKTVEALPGGHIGEERRATDIAIARARDWFVERDLVNPW